MEKNIPPINNQFASYAQLTHIASHNDERKEPHIIFMSYDLSRRVRMELDKRNISFEDFVMKACVDYLKAIDNQNKLTESFCPVQSHSTAQSLSDTFVSVSLNSSNEDKELAEQMINLHKLGAFKKSKKDLDHEPLLKSKKRGSKDSKHYDKK